ncbi:MAG: hypothetical protein ABSE49_03370 [Polyangiaceae bacterium]
MDATTPCTTLVACCATLTGAPQTLCNAVVGIGNANDCSTELSQLAGEGDCVGQGPPGETGDAGGGSPPGKISDASTGIGPDGGGSDAGPALPPAACASTSCSAPEVCVALPGNSASCGAPCQADGDCPAWLTCQNGICAQCSEYGCPAGQRCSWVTSPRPAQCSSNAACGLGNYCQGGNCMPILGCTACYSGCTTCATNSQCSAGEVCVGQACQACTASGQCGPSAVCQATHSGMQCTCSQDTDCSSGETCQSGVCGSSGIPGCASGLPGSACPTGQACINATCGPCTTFEDCNAQAFGTPTPPGGLACVDGVCAACSINAQCGGGMACVGGTCGTCSTNAQCGPTGQCTGGYCTCSSDSQCASGQRCGSGVCVAM